MFCFGRRIDIALERMSEGQIGSLQLMDPTPRAELDAHVAQLVRMSSHVQIYSLELMVRSHFPPS